MRKAEHQSTTIVDTEVEENTMTGMSDQTSTGEERGLVRETGKESINGVMIGQDPAPEIEDEDHEAETADENHGAEIADGATHETSDIEITKSGREAGRRGIGDTAAEADHAHAHLTRKDDIDAIDCADLWILPCGAL